jgi:hypothetical protein
MSSLFLISYDLLRLNNSAFCAAGPKAAKHYINRGCLNKYGGEAMKTYRFVTTTHQDVIAETLEEAIEAFNRVRQAGLSPEVDTVGRIEVRDEEGEYVPVDHRLKAKYPVANKREEIRLSA